MSEDRSCLDCPADLTGSHPNRQRCTTCAEKRNGARGRAASQLRYETVGARQWHLTCTSCGRSFTSPKKTQVYCTHRCSKSVRVTRQCSICLGDFRTYAARPGLLCSPACRSWEKRNGPGPAPLCDRECGWCAAPIVGRNRKSLYCTARCMRTAAQARRQAKGAGNLTRDRVLALHVFNRDEWLCHLCDRPIDREVRDGPLMPSLDHLIPVSHPEYPGHAIWNLAAAHLRCNSLRKAEITAAVRDRFHDLCRQYGMGELLAPAEGGVTRVTHCKWNHAYDPDDTYPGKRYCRQCNRDRAQSSRRST